MASVPTTGSPRTSVDARGRLIPLSAEEDRLRIEAAIRGFEEIAAMGDEEEQRATFEALVEGLNGADGLSSRKRFSGCE